MHRMNRILGGLALAAAIGIPPAAVSAHALGPDADDALGLVELFAKDCATQPWLAGDLRTWAVTSGHIKVR